MRDKVVKKLGIEVICKTRRTIEITMSEDWADCVVCQAEKSLEHSKGKLDEDGYTIPSQEFEDLINAISEALR